VRMPTVATCSRLSCYLAENGALVSFPLITIAGIVDGINPCAIGMMLLLMGYLMTFTHPDSKKLPTRVLLIGVTYILSVFFTYLLVGFFFYASISALHLDVVRSVVNPVLGFLLVVAAAIQVKDFFKPEWPIHLRIPSASRAKLMPLIEKSSFPSAVLLGILVTLLETPCSLPIYVGTANILAQSGMSPFMVSLYFLYYNLLFVLPLIVVLIAVWKFKHVVSLKEWEHRVEKWMKLGIGMVLLAMGGYLLWAR